MLLKQILPGDVVGTQSFGAAFFVGRLNEDREIIRDAVDGAGQFLGTAITINVCVGARRQQRFGMSGGS